MIIFRACSNTRGEPYGSLIRLMSTIYETDEGHSCFRTLENRAMLTEEPRSYRLHCFKVLVLKYELRNCCLWLKSSLVTEMFFGGCQWAICRGPLKKQNKTREETCLIDHHRHTISRMQDVLKNIGTKYDSNRVILRIPKMSFLCLKWRCLCNEFTYRKIKASTHLLATKGRTMTYNVIIPVCHGVWSPSLPSTEWLPRLALLSQAEPSLYDRERGMSQATLLAEFENITQTRIWPHYLLLWRFWTQTAHQNHHTS